MFDVWNHLGKKRGFINNARIDARLSFDEMSLVFSFFYYESLWKDEKRGIFRWRTFLQGHFRLLPLSITIKIDYHGVYLINAED
jgi:hypothetical protein